MEVGAEGGGDKVYHGGLAGAVSANQKLTSSWKDSDRSFSPQRRLTVNVFNMLMAPTVEQLAVLAATKWSRTFRRGLRKGPTALAAGPPPCASFVHVGAGECKGHEGGGVGHGRTMRRGVRHECRGASVAQTARVCRMMRQNPHPVAEPRFVWGLRWYDWKSYPSRSMSFSHSTQTQGPPPFEIMRGMRGLKDKRVLITGGASGIGAATAARFLEEGSRVCVLDRDAVACKHIKHELPGARRGRHL